jgi:hypothetical protein
MERTEQVMQSRESHGNLKVGSCAPINVRLWVGRSLPFAAFDAE